MTAKSELTRVTVPLLQCAETIESTSTNKLVVTGRCAYPPVDPSKVRLPDGIQGSFEADGTFRLRLRIPLTRKTTVSYDARV